jgi:transcription elongation factor Elf1
MTIKKLKPKDEKSIVSEEYKEKERPRYICSMCNQIVLVKLKDFSGNNTTYWCKMCQVSFDPEVETLKEDVSVSLPYNAEEEGPGIISIQDTPDVSIRHEPEPELRGGFKVLSQKGTIRFTSYNTTEKE